MKKVLVTMLLLVSLTGCSSVGSYYVVNPIIETSKLTDNSGESLFLKDGKQINTEGMLFKREYLKAKSEKKPRNYLLSNILLLSDEVCEKHKGDILGTSATLNVSLGTATSIFSGLGAVVGGEAVKGVLAAAAGVTNSSRSLFNEEVYFNSFAITIIKAIDSDRKVLKKIVMNGMDSTIAEYSIDKGILDSVTYHNSCSFQNGLKIVSEAVDRRKPSTTEIREKVDYLQDQIKKNQNLNMTEENVELKAELVKLQLLYPDASY